MDNDNHAKVGVTLLPLQGKRSILPTTWRLVLLSSSGDNAVTAI